MRVVQYRATTLLMARPKISVIMAHSSCVVRHLGIRMQAKAGSGTKTGNNLRDSVSIWEPTTGLKMGCASKTSGRLLGG